MPTFRLSIAPCFAAGLTFAVAAMAPAHATPATFFFGGTPYRSSADIPAGFYLGGAPTLLENFEDGALDATLSGNSGQPLAPGGNTDSVDADDGTINGSGTRGRSWFGGSSITFTFVGSGPLPTAFGLVWTDGAFGATFSALAADGSSLGSISHALGDSSFNGGTEEDRFFGVQFAGGVKSITITAATGGAMELDHIQYGAMPSVPGPESVPEPASAALVLGGLALLARRRATAQRR